MFVAAPQSGVQSLLSAPAMQFELLWAHFSGFLVSMVLPRFVRYALLELLANCLTGRRASVSGAKLGNAH